MDESNQNNYVLCNSTLTEPVCQNCSRAQDYPYRTILKFLHTHHKLKIPLRTLKTNLKIFEFVRRNVLNQNTAQKLEEAVRKELSRPSTNSGYRTI